MRPDEAVTSRSGSASLPLAWTRASSAPSEPAPSTARRGSDSRASSAIGSASVPAAVEPALGALQHGVEARPRQRGFSVSRGAGPSTASACATPVRSASGTRVRSRAGFAMVPPIAASAVTACQATPGGSRAPNRPDSTNARSP